MVKKFIIICICLVTMVTVLGLNDRLTYDGFDVASKTVTGSVDIVKSDIAFFESFAYIAETYSRNDDGIYYTEYDAETNILTISYLSMDGNIGAGSFKNFEMPSDDVGLKIEGLLSPMEFGLPNQGGLFEDVIDAINYIIHILILAFVVLQFILIIVFDSIGVALSVLRAAFYLLGF